MHLAHEALFPLKRSVFSLPNSLSSSLAKIQSQIVSDQNSRHLSMRLPFQEGTFHTQEEMWEYLASPYKKRKEPISPLGSDRSAYSPEFQKTLFPHRI